MKNLKLKAARALLDMSQKDLADAVHVSRQTINATLLNCAGQSAVCWGRVWMNCFGRMRKMNRCCNNNFTVEIMAAFEYNKSIWMRESHRKGEQYYENLQGKRLL